MMRMYVAALGLTLFSSQPVLAQEREWSLASAGEDVFLVFGVPETPDIGVSFWCKAGTKDVSVFTPLSAPGPRKDKQTISLTVNSNNYVLAANPSEDNTAASVEAQLKPRAKILAELAEADHFSVTVGKHVSTFPLTNADFKGLIEMCATPVAEPEN